jgi:hypothetical protein
MAEPAPDRVRVSGPLAAFADGFLVDLVEQGYRQWPAQKQLYFLASVSRWMETVDVGVSELTSRAVERFVADPQRAAYRNRLSSKSLRPLLAYLGGLGVLPAGDGEPLTPVERLLAEFRDYLLVERALTAGSVVGYMSRPRACFSKSARCRSVRTWPACPVGRSTRSCYAKQAGGASAPPRPWWPPCARC